MLEKLYSKVYYWLLPFINQYGNIFLSKKFLKYYEKCEDPQIIEIKEYIMSRRKFNFFNYDWTDKYDTVIKDTKVYKDKDCGLFYLMYNNRPLYFKDSFKKKKEVLIYYKSLIVEQDIMSPHRYLTDEFCPNINDIVVDAGGAEGNFSLDIIDKCNRVIIVESDEKWIEALQHTFADEIKCGKVILINKMLTNENSSSSVTLDAIMDKYGEVNFVKMDIEGGEQCALIGAERLLRKNKPLNLALCAYHTPKAEKEIIDILGESFNISFAYGYLCIIPIIGAEPPYARHGVIQAVKKAQDKLN